MDQATSVQRTTDGTAVARRCRVRSVTYTDVGAAGGGYVQLKDGGAGGTVKWTIGASGQYGANSNTFAGLLFETDLYLDFTGGVSPVCSVEYE